MLLDNLPGYPDNLLRGLDGKIWAGLFKPRNPNVDNDGGQAFHAQAHPASAAGRYGRCPRPTGTSFAFTEDGKVVADLQDHAGAYPETTSVTETPDRLYIQSLHGKTLAWMPRPSNQASQLK